MDAGSRGRASVVIHIHVVTEIVEVGRCREMPRMHCLCTRILSKFQLVKRWNECQRCLIVRQNAKRWGPKGGEEAQPCWVEKKIAQCDKLT